MSTRAKLNNRKQESKDSVERSLERHREIIVAAYQAIAERGFEGLRMREIAKRAGMNHATLHYYFDGKEAVIEGVLTYIVEQLAIGREAPENNRGLSPRQRLAAYFSQLVHQMRERPEIFVVLTEINARSVRDPNLRAVMARHDRGWRSFLSELLKQGIQKGEYRADLNPELTATMIISFLRGLYISHRGRSNDLDRALQCFTRVLGLEPWPTTSAMRSSPVRSMKGET